MARKRKDPTNTPYKFDKEVDVHVKGGTEALFDVDTGKTVVMKRTFTNRRNAQIANRKRQGM